ncbi:hypothetical protein NXS19_014301 [Fusarium pseudograminearum]|nr:hypothetical protein NXS19_014301 [Fusarium pseudograminearum]
MEKTQDTARVTGSSGDLQSCTSLIQVGKLKSCEVTTYRKSPPAPLAKSPPSLGSLSPVMRRIAVKEKT